MAGLYLHIPFCKQACYYCDFHFSTNLSLKREMVDAMITEMISYRHFFENKPAETIYYGGGTPTILNHKELSQLQKAVFNTFRIIDNPEITVEANPDDITTEKLEVLKDLKFNRISLGIQSFNDKALTWMNRAHNSKMAVSAIEQIRSAGFKNLNLDLIYGLPVLNNRFFKKDLDELLAWDPEHISAYCLTIEPGTVFGNWVNKGKIKDVDEEVAVSQYETIMKTLEDKGYQHYEISNFAKPGFESLHNKNYWNHDPYLGIGPGAHSFNGKQRWYNISHNPKYVKSFKENRPPHTFIDLSKEDRINEYIITRLRTSEGIDPGYLKKKYGFDLINNRQREISIYCEQNKLDYNGQNIILTNEGKLLADKIATDLFINDD